MRKEKDRKDREAEKLARLEKEYQHRIVQPVQACQRQLTSLLEQLPQSPTALRRYIGEVRDQACREWNHQYIVQCELPIRSFELKLDRVKTILDGFRMAVSTTMAQTRFQASSEWLESKIDYIAEQLANVNQDLQLEQDRIRALQRAVVEVTKQFTEEHAHTKEQGLHKRSRVLANDYVWGMAELLRCLNDSSLLNIKQELIARNRWSYVGKGLPTPKMLWFGSGLLRYATLQKRKQDQPTDLPFQSGLDNNLLKGAHRWQTSQALFALLSARATLSGDALEIARLLHLWRQFDTQLRSLNAVPYFFSHQIAVERLAHIKEESDYNMQAANIELKVYGSIRFITNDRGILAPSSRHNRMMNTMTRLLNLQAGVEHWFNTTFCQGMSVLLLSPMSGLERSLVATYRPFYDYINACNRVLFTTRDLLSTRVGFGWLQQPSYHLTSLSTVLDRLRVSTVEMYEPLRQAILWSRASGLYQGKLYHPEPKLQVGTTVDSRPPALDWTQMEIIGTPPNADLYPERRGIPIKYVTSREDAQTEFRALASARLVALDAVVIEYTDHFNIRRPRIEFVLLASETTVVIFHATHTAGRVENFLTSLGLILENPEVVKVGLNMSFVRQQLHDEYQWDTQGSLNLAGDSDATIYLDGNSDPTQEQLAQLALKHLGTRLPGAPDAKTMLSEGSQDPFGYFRYLATRAYLPLRLHRAAQAQISNDERVSGSFSPYSARQEQAGAAASRPPDDRVELGPVHIFPCMYKSVAREDLSVCLPFSSRPQYLRETSATLAGSVLKREGMKFTDTVFKSLQAYYLATMFDEPLRSIDRILRLENVRNLYRKLTWVATKFNLPLHDGHRIALEAEARNLGARTTISSGRSKSVSSRPLDSEPAPPVSEPLTKPSVSVQVGPAPVENEHAPLGDAISTYGVHKMNVPEVAQENKERRPGNQRLRRQTDPDYRIMENLKRSARRRRARRRLREENSRRGLAELEQAAPATNGDHNASNAILAPSPDSDMIGGFYDILLPWTPQSSHTEEESAHSKPPSPELGIGEAAFWSPQIPGEKVRPVQVKSPLFTMDDRNAREEILREAGHIEPSSGPRKEAVFPTDDGLPPAEGRQRLGRRGRARTRLERREIRMAEDPKILRALRIAVEKGGLSPEEVAIVEKEIAIKEEIARINAERPKPSGPFEILEDSKRSVRGGSPGTKIGNRLRAGGEARRERACEDTSKIADSQTLAGQRVGTSEGGNITLEKVVEKWAEPEMRIPSPQGVVLRKLPTNAGPGSDQVVSVIKEHRERGGPQRISSPESLIVRKVGSHPGIIARMVAERLERDGKAGGRRRRGRRRGG